MKVGDTIIFNKRGWYTIEYGSRFTILEISYFPCNKRRKKCYKIFDGDGYTFVRSKNFSSLKKIRKDKLEKINESR